MARTFSLLRLCSRSRAGSVAITFGLAAVPIVGIVGAAIDYSNLTRIRSEIHKDIDGYALAIAKGTPLQDISGKAEQDLLQKHGERIRGITFEAEWISPIDAQITARMDIRMSMLAVIGIRSMPMTVVTVARNNVTYTTAPPVMVQLDPDAGDYNQMYSYCYDPLHVTGDGRSQMSLMADRSCTSPSRRASRAKPPATVFVTSATRGAGRISGTRLRPSSTTTIPIRSSPQPTYK